MAIDNDGLDALATGIKDIPSLKLYALSDAGTTLQGSASVTYVAGTTGVIDISTNATITIAAGITIDRVKLGVGAGLPTTTYARETLTTDNVFPNGGDLIITSFKITVA